MFREWFAFGTHTGFILMWSVIAFFILRQSQSIRMTFRMTFRLLNLIIVSILRRTLFTLAVLGRAIIR